MDSSKLLNKVNPNILYTVVAMLLVLCAIGSAIYLYFTIANIESQDKTLLSVSKYSFASLSSNDFLKNEYPSRKSLNDIFGYRSFLQQEIEKSKDQRKKLSIPYKNFLRFLYTPSLNIWKSSFSDDIDISLVGEKYLLNNPYDDIELIQKWTNFFKDMGVVDQYNTISDISLGSIETVKGGLFYLPITVQFETPDRRSFLLLVSKLSMTSYAENVSLINEYMFYLWESIKENKSKEIKKMLAEESLPSLVTTEDQLIGYSLYQWIKNNNSTPLIDENVINQAISNAARCVDQSSQECLYMFRDKYRTVPYLAYGIARTNRNNVEGLRQFFVNMPPLIAIESFSFDPKAQKGKKSRDAGYKGSISIKVYGKDVAPNEVSEIALRLGGLCFQDKSPISSTYGISLLNRLVEQLGKQDSINAKRSYQLNEMLSYITQIDVEYDSLSNYKKVVRLFEIYRTLQEGNACDFITKQDIVEMSGEGDAQQTTNSGIVDNKKEVIGQFSGSLLSGENAASSGKELLSGTQNTLKNNSDNSTSLSGTSEKTSLVE